jgi:hypothetical protein
MPPYVVAGECVKQLRSESSTGSTQIYLVLLSAVRRLALSFCQLQPSNAKCDGRPSVTG